MKSEPDTFSIDDLERVQVEGWDGVRNYMARNFMRDEMKKGDGVLFYHSNATPPGVVGIAKVVKEGHPDPTQFDPSSKYFDATSPDDDPRWIQVAVGFVEKFDDIVSLDELKLDERLEGMLVVQRGQRLSVQPVAPEHFKRVVAKGRNPKRRKPKALREKLEKLARKGSKGVKKKAKKTKSASKKAAPKKRAANKSDAGSSKRAVTRKAQATKRAKGKKRTAAKAKANK